MKPDKFEELGAVPGDGEQARPSGSEKPKVAIMATHLNKHGFLFLLAPLELFFKFDLPLGKPRGFFYRGTSRALALFQAAPS